MPRQAETLQTVVTKEKNNTPLLVEVKNKGKARKSLFSTSPTYQMELIIEGETVAKMSYELHSNYLLVKETFIHSGYVNLTAALFEYAFKQSELNGKQGNVRYEVLATNTEKWKKYGFTVKSTHDKKSMLHFTKEVIESKRKREVAMGNHFSKPHEKSVTHTSEKKKDKKTVEVQHDAGDIQELTLLNKKIQSVDIAIKSLTTIPLDNLYACVHRLNPYIDAYIENTRKPSLNLFDFHGSTGRERALKYLADWKEGIAKQIISSYKLKLNELTCRGSSLTSSELVRIFVDAMSDLEEAAHHSVMTVEGNRHEHSLRMYLLAYANELSGICDPSSSAINPFTHAITFPNSIAPASLAVFEQKAKEFAAKRFEDAKRLAR